MAIRRGKKTTRSGLSLDATVEDYIQESFLAGNSSIFEDAERESQSDLVVGDCGSGKSPATGSASSTATQTNGVPSVPCGSHSDFAFSGWQHLQEAKAPPTTKAGHEGFTSHVTFLREGKLYVLGGMNSLYAQAWNSEDNAQFYQAQTQDITFFSYDLTTNEWEWVEQVGGQSNYIPQMFDGHSGVYIPEKDAVYLISHQRPWEILWFDFEMKKWHRQLYANSLPSSQFLGVAMYRAHTPYSCSNLDLTPCGSASPTATTPCNTYMACFGGIVTGSALGGCINHLVFLIDRPPRVSTSPPIQGERGEFQLAVAPTTDATPMARMKGALTAMGDTLYLYGGYSAESHRDGADPFLDDLHSWRAGIWQQLQYKPAPQHGPLSPFYRLNRSRSHIVAIPEANGLLIGSGMWRQDYRADDLLFFDLSDSSWHVLDRGTRQEECPQSPLKLAGSVMVSDPADPLVVYVVGGGHGDGIAVAPVVRTVFKGALQLSLRAMVARRFASELLDG